MFMELCRSHLESCWLILELQRITLEPMKVHPGGVEAETMEAHNSTRCTYRLQSQPSRLQDEPTRFQMATAKLHEHPLQKNKTRGYLGKHPQFKSGPALPRSEPPRLQASLLSYR
jgi:hypothetical protein